MWGGLQQGISTLDVDFVAYAAEHFDDPGNASAPPSSAPAQRPPATEPEDPSGLRPPRSTTGVDRRPGSRIFQDIGLGTASMSVFRSAAASDTAQRWAFVAAAGTRRPGPSPSPGSGLSVRTGPILGAQPGDQPDIPRVRVPEPSGVVQQQKDDVDDVLLIDRTICSWDSSSSARGIVGRSTSGAPPAG